MIQMTYITDGNLTKRYLITNLNKKKFNTLAREKFEEGVAKGQIEGAFEDEMWVLLTEGRRKRYIK